MPKPSEPSDIQLFLEELCCDLCRFRHMAEGVIEPDEVRVDREVPLGPAGAFADIRVTGPSIEPYFVEIKYGLSNDELLGRIRFKYGTDSDAIRSERGLIVMTDAPKSSKDQIEDALTKAVPPQLKVELWDPARLLALVEQTFHIGVDSLSETNLLAIREAVQRVKGYFAFGDGEIANYQNDPLRAELLWRFAFWRLKEIRGASNLVPREVLPPGLYKGVAVVIADLCSFSSFVRDTPDDRIIRYGLTSFYSKTRYDIINRGGMLDNFVGDQVLALFGVPDRRSGCLEDALDCAAALSAIGNAVASEWQRRIDRVQPSGGVHVGVAFGDLQIIPLRPASRTHVGTIADVINVGARLMASAGAGEIMVSNAFYQQLSSGRQGKCSEMPPLEAKNVGKIRAWKFVP